MRETYGCIHNKHPPKATCLFRHSRAQHHMCMIKKKIRVKMMPWRVVACLHFQPGGGILATFFVTRNPRQFSLHSDVSSPFAARLCPGCRRCAIAYEPAPTDAPCAEVCGAHDARSQHPRAADDTGGGKRRGVQRRGDSPAGRRCDICGEKHIGVGRFLGGQLLDDLNIFELF